MFRRSQLGSNTTWIAIPLRPTRKTPPALTCLLDLCAVKEMLQIARSDLDRVKKQTPLPNVKEIEEAFELEGACPGCAGAVLLLKTSKGAAYVHWHRES